jgi:cyclopropane fatty-acyl-phospholipid synthase-like methyltransferase
LTGRRSTLPRNDDAARPPAAAPSFAERLIAYYEDAGPDFEEWSSDFNMHFGYYRWPLNPFRRERMLNEMNRQALDRLALPADRDDLIVDLGCGVGATVRYAALRFPAKRLLGVTIVPWQATTGNAWNQRLGLGSRARLQLADYTNTGLPSRSADGVIAIESACHALGARKETFVREAARILKPGARVVVADGFLKNPGRPLGRVFGRLHASLCRSFVLPELGQIEEFTRALREHGFEDVVAEDCSWRVAPSALHAPVAVAWFVVKKAIRRERLGARRIDNLRGSVLSAVLGANRLKFGYYLTSAVRT